MAGVLSTNCCCMSMKPTPSPSSLRRSAQVPWAGKEGWWRRHVAVGVAACMIITLQNGEIISLNKDSTSVANGAVLAVAESSKKLASAQWSNQRRCQPWRLNSLETIVPENLPRPSPHRTWEKVNHSKSHHSAAPSLQIMLTQDIHNCFTM